MAASIALGYDLRTLFDVPARTLWSMIYLGLVSNGICWIFYMRLMRRIGAVRSSSVTYVLPLVAIMIDLIYFGALPRAVELLGSGIIIVGIRFCIRKKERRRVKELRCHLSYNTSKISYPK